MSNELLCSNCGVPQEIHGSTCCGWMNASPVIFPWEKTIPAAMTDEEKKLRWGCKDYTQEQWQSTTASAAPNPPQEVKPINVTDRGEEQDWQFALRKMRDMKKFDDKYNTKTLEFVYAFQMGFKAWGDFKDPTPAASEQAGEAVKERLHDVWMKAWASSHYTPQEMWHYLENKAKEFTLPLTEAEIEKMAEERYPYALEGGGKTVFMDFNQLQHKKREAFISGYTAKQK